MSRRAKSGTHQRSRQARRKKRARRAPAASVPAAGTKGASEAVRIEGDRVAFSARQLMRYYLAENWDAISESFLRILHHVSRRTRTEMLDPDRQFIDSLVENLLYYFTKPNYAISARYAIDFLRMQPVVANLVAVSRFQTSDPQLKMLLETPGNLLRPGRMVKVLVLYNARSTVRIDRKALFDVAPQYASLWYSEYFIGSEAYATETTYRNMREHVEAMDERFEYVGQSLAMPYFKPSYTKYEAEPLVRGTINRAVRKACRHIEIRNRPRPGRIAIVTSRWHPQASVYRSIAPFVASLADDYDLTLVHMSPRTTPDRKVPDELFTDVRWIPDITDGGFRADGVADNDFQLVYYVDVGLVEESIFLANLRLAPIQVTGYGHPVSTFGTEVDYFIGGAEVELADQAADNYAERLVLIPGIGALPVWPSHRPQATEKDFDGILVNCPWAAMKANYPLLQCLAEVIRRCERKVVYQFFPGGSVMTRNAFLPFLQDLRAVLGAEHVRLWPGCTPEEYMAHMAGGDLSLDPYPFGGYNTIVDSLYLHKPVVCREGVRFPSRCAAALLRRVGLDDLIADDPQQYVQTICRMVQDDDYRRAKTEPLAEMDLKGRLYNPDEARYFKKAIDYLIANHERLQAEGGRKPILIE